MINKILKGKTRNRDRWRQIQRTVQERKHNFKDGQDMNKQRENIEHFRQRLE